MVQDFQFLVTDDRYSVPSLRFVEASDADAARAIAERLLREHEHYHVIDVWDGDVRLFTVGVAHRLRPRARWAAGEDKRTAGRPIEPLARGR